MEDALRTCAGPSDEHRFAGLLMVAKLSGELQRKAQAPRRARAPAVRAPLGLPAAPSWGL